MPFGLGIAEVFLIFAVLLLVFGAKRLPEIGGAMGQSIRDFKRSINGMDGSDDKERIAAPEKDRAHTKSATAAGPAAATDDGEPHSLRAEDGEPRSLRQEQEQEQE